MSDNDIRGEDFAGSMGESPTFGSGSAAGSSGSSSKSQAGTAARTGKSNVPPEVSKAVLAFDKTSRTDRNIPDKKYGPVIVDASKTDDGSWIVRVGSMETSVAGPKEGTKPIDIATYTFKDGKVSASESMGNTSLQKGNASAAKPFSVPSVADFDRDLEESDFASPEDDHVVGEGTTYASQETYDEGKGGYRGEVKSETRDAPNAPSKMGPAKSEQLKVKPSKSDLGAKKDLDAEASSAATSEGMKSATKADAKSQTASKAIIDKAVAAAKGLIEMDESGEPILVDRPEPQSIKRFQSFLGGLEQSSKLDEFKKAAQECKGHESDESSEKSGGSHFQIVSSLVEKYGTDTQKNAWKR